MREFAHSLTIDAPPAVVLDAFFDQEALAECAVDLGGRAVAGGRAS